MATDTAIRSDAHAYIVGEFDDLARVTIRTLHQYDAIGLLEPSGRTEASYRLRGRIQAGLPASTD